MSGRIKLAGAFLFSLSVVAGQNCVPVGILPAGRYDVVAKHLAYYYSPGNYTLTLNQVMATPMGRKRVPK